MKAPSLILLLATCFSFLAHTQNISGDWHGLRAYPDRPIRMILNIDQDGPEVIATYDSPDNDVFEIQLEASYKHPLLTLDYEGNDITFKGIFIEEKQVIEGIYRDGDESFPLTLGRNPIEAPPMSFAVLKEKFSKTEIYITMRDGKRLFTSIYVPKDTTKTYPILLNRTPYNIEPDPDTHSGRLLNMWHLLEEGYIIAFQDVRGRFMSEGEFVDVRPYRPNKKRTEIDENSDTYDTIDWLVKNVKTNNGNAGIFGISYPGFYSTMALPEAHPALKAASPQAPVGNWFIGDDWHHNGAFFLMDASNFYSTIGRLRPEPTRSWPTPMDFGSEDNYDFYLDLGPVKKMEEKYFGDSIQFWSDLMTHPNYDHFWKARNLLPHLKDVKPAVLVVGGWFDAEDLYGPLQTYRMIEKLNSNNQNRLVMGPWYHGQWASRDGRRLGNIHWGSNTSEYFKEIELEFFNYYLKDKGNMNLPEASIFLTGANEWRSFDQWPPASTETGRLYLQPGGGLSFSPPSISESFDEYVSDPDKPVPYTEDVHFSRTIEYLTDDQRFAGRRPDVMVYQSEELNEDITITGPMEVQFFVSTTGTDADYVVKLIDVFPDQMEDYPENDKDVPMGGYQMLVRGEVLRGRFRNSFENPEPFVPGEVTEVSFQIPDLAHTFKQGHRIMIQVQNSWFPLMDRNPQQFVNIYECDEDDFVKATHRIYHDASRPSNVSVGIMKED